MNPIDRCPECGVPKHVTSEHMWLSSGVLVQSRESRNRMVFMECENLDPLFHGVEELIGMPIEHLVIESKRKGVRSYLDNLVPEVTKDLLHKRELDWKPINDGFRAIAGMTGYGSYEVLDYRFEKDVDDYITETISEPYSVPLACGDMAGAFEILFGYDLGVRYEKLSDDLYQFTCFVSSHPAELIGRLRSQRSEIKKGDIEFERCASCGGPMDLTDYRWHPGRGVIESISNGKRMVLTGMELNAIFGELEEELGDVIPRAVVEAQRRFVRTGFYDIEGMGRKGMRNQLALRGLGNIVELKSNERGLTIRIENAFLHLILVGLVQGLYECTYDIDSQVEWELSQDNVLEVEVYPASVAIRKTLPA